MGDLGQDCARVGRVEKGIAQERDRVGPCRPEIPDHKVRCRRLLKIDGQRRFGAVAVIGQRRASGLLVADLPAQHKAVHHIPVQQLLQPGDRRLEIEGRQFGAGNRRVRRHLRAVGPVQMGQPWRVEKADMRPGLMPVVGDDPVGVGGDEHGFGQLQPAVQKGAQILGMVLRCRQVVASGDGDGCAVRNLGIGV